jgi:tetratricopeptide (TPR) repeat protein
MNRRSRSLRRQVRIFQGRTNCSHEQIQDRAVKALRAAIAEYSDPKAWKALTSAYLANNNASGLINEYIRVIKKEEMVHESRLWEDLHNVCSEVLDFDQLIQLYEATLLRNPYRWQMWYRLGDIYKSGGNFNSAMESYERAITFHPDGFDLRVRLGKVYEAQGKKTSAISVYKKGIEMSPTDPWPRWHLGRAHSSIGNHNEAIQVFESGIEHYPTCTQLWDGLAISYVCKGESEKAIEVYRRGMFENPTGTWLSMGLGKIYKRAGNYQSAIAAYETARNDHDKSFLWSLINTSKVGPEVDFDIDDSLMLMFPWVALTSAYKAAGNMAEAVTIRELVISEYSKVLESSEENNLLWEYHNAIPHDKFRRKYLSKAIVRAVLGEAYSANGEYSRAIDVYNRALTGTRNSAWMTSRLNEAINNAETIVAHDAPLAVNVRIKNVS